LEQKISVSDLLAELEALRVRLDQASEWFSRPAQTLKAGALAEEVKHICQEAANCEEEARLPGLLALARQRLDELQALLGSH
jgi:hypothetical protein